MLNAVIPKQPADQDQMSQKAHQAVLDTSTGNQMDLFKF